MAELDQNSADCHVFTFKEGLLSSVAHDLKLRVGRWTLRVTGGDGGAGRFGLEASLDAGSLAVEAVMRDGRAVSGVLGPRDTDKIAKTIREEVLASTRHPTIAFRGTATLDGEATRIDGQLTICGKSKTVSTKARPEGDAWVVEVPIHQPDFGIKPYSAMFGTLKIKPEIRVAVRVPQTRIASLIATS